jgi:cytochrome c-type biogenesis protein CcmF
LGTFLVRSGVLTSVHAFATDPRRGIFILALLTLVIGSSLFLFALRSPRVGLGSAFDLVSRETALLANNALFVVATGSVFLGTLYPLAMDAFGLGKISVGPPYFEAVFVPVMTPVLFLMGVGPITRWRNMPLPELAVRLRWALAVSVVSAIVIPLLLGRWSWLVALGMLLAVWVTATCVVSLWRRLRQSSGSVWNRLTSSSSSYYGMLLAHFGIALFVVGVTLVKGYETDAEVRMVPGDTVQLAGYTFHFDGVREVKGPNYVAARATMRVTREGRETKVLYPEKRIYNVQRMPMTESDIDTGLTRHLYVALGDMLGDNAWLVRVQYKPFVSWIWIGCLVMALGGVFAASDRRYRVAYRGAPAVQRVSTGGRAQAASAA